MQGNGDYIPREAFKQEVIRVSTHYLNEWSTLGVLAAADRIPAADVRPVVRGEWEEEDSASNRWSFRCSVCGKGGRGYKFNYCSNCGADMRPEPPKEG